MPGDPSRSPPGPNRAYTGQTQNIGELKRFACQACRGDVLVEVDHDDELTPDCLTELAAAFSDPRVDFATRTRARSAMANPGSTTRSSAGDIARSRGMASPSSMCVAFEPTPWSFSKIWFAPNHVRAWRSSFYHRIGGHDPSRAVLDDHDLLCRTTFTAA